MPAPHEQSLESIQVTLRMDNREPSELAQLQQERLQQQFEARLLAYELGSMASSKIQKEGSKTAPHLNKMIGHAAIYDHAMRLIIDHVDGYGHETHHLELNECER